MFFFFSFLFQERWTSHVSGWKSLLVNGLVSLVEGS